jgi:GDPmannose 4,6-dehydratase/GDP-4-dehydro-6-deoxy-D-mannose reductase
MRALITGIHGAAAHYLREYLIEHGDEVHGIGRPQVELTDYAQVVTELRAIAPEVIYHLAADADVLASFEDGGRTLRNNIDGAFNVLEAARNLSKQPVVQICSTSEVYGDPELSPAGETWPLVPSNPYAVSKTAQDLLGQMYAKCYGMRVVITRAFGYVNPRRRDLCLSSFASQIVAIERGLQDVLKHGNLDSVRTFCDTRDIARAYAFAADLQGVYNIGSEAEISIWQCLEILKGMAHRPIRTEPDPKLMRPLDIKRCVPDCTKFRMATGWEPVIPLEDSLRWLLNYYRMTPT